MTAGTDTTGMVMELATTCSGAENERLALERLAVMRKSRFINLAFSKKLDAIIRGRTGAWKAFHEDDRATEISEVQNFGII